MAAMLICLYFLLIGVLQRARAQEQICLSCPGELRNSSEVSHRCTLIPGARIVGRCCVTQHAESDVIIGLDLWNCSISHLDPNVHLTAAAVVIDFSQNPLQELSTGFFLGLTGLQYVALPLNISCPGGEDVWESVRTTTGAQICEGQRDGCNNTGGAALLCPENSLCAPDGPGYTQCVCAPGFLGYKCLRQGSFPILMFSGILASVTVSLSVLLWCTQRRKVKDH
ncbi:all-trans retinoic acid-induced differentiation factor [Mixophyes fleayi]|uniref:all-trans retinoic acid-induced differentiation factor n=1 Tax=Mixophyes fleayi TaxID=3061075 RepID=UPI003F4DEF02